MNKEDIRLLDKHFSGEALNEEETKALADLTKKIKLIVNQIGLQEALGEVEKQLHEMNFSKEAK